MKETLEMRIAILEDNGIISSKVAAYARWVIGEILSAIPEVSQDKAEIFITHLAMAGKRAEEGTEENPIDPVLLDAVRQEVIFPKAVAFRDHCLSGTDLTFSETEKDFLSVHMCNLMS